MSSAVADRKVAWNFERTVTDAFASARVAWTDLSADESLLEAMVVLQDPNDWDVRLAILQAKGEFELANDVRVICMFQSPDDDGIPA